ncbi:MAG: vitamin K epoxide reductase family protein, partial [Myxococcota bacterium]
MKDSTASGLTGLLSLIGAAISVYLAQAHITVKSGEKAGGVCDLGATLNCDAAAASAYSTVAGVPIAIVGLAGYVACVALVGWYLSQKAPRSKDPISIAGTLQTFFGVSVVYSVFLAVVSILVLPAICPACVALYVVNIIGLVLTTLWTGRGPLSTLGAQLKDLGKALGQPAALGFVAIVVAVVVLGTGYTNAAIDRSS